MTAQEWLDAYGNRGKTTSGEDLAAARLADQEAIEQHTRQRVAGEIVDIMNHCETFQDVKAVILQTYGVE